MLDAFCGAGGASEGRTAECGTHGSHAVPASGNAAVHYGGDPHVWCVLQPPVAAKALRYGHKRESKTRA
jgi:hypothetical protein